MNSLIPLTLLLVLSVFYVANQKQQSKLLTTLVVIVVVLFLCMMDMREKFANYATPSHKGGVCGGIDVSKLPRTSLVRGYDRLVVKEEEDGHKLVSDVSISTPTGDDVKLESDLMAAQFPSIDGQKDSPRHMFTLAKNQCHPGCCPSDYSCSTGCVCTSQNQRDFINKRGGNRNSATSQEI